MNNFITLPSELLVYILSFLKITRDLVKLWYISRRFRSVCETSSLWRDFIWPHFDSREGRCLKSVLRSCGQYIRRLSFPRHVMPSKLISMLQHCSNVSLPMNKLTPDQLRKILQLGAMEKLEHLDIPWTKEIFPLLETCVKLKELTVRINRLRTSLFFDGIV